MPIEGVEQLRLEDEQHTSVDGRSLPDAYVFVVEILGPDLSCNSRYIAEGIGSSTANGGAVGINEGSRVEVAILARDKGVQLAGAIGRARQGLGWIARVANAVIPTWDRRGAAK